MPVGCQEVFSSKSCLLNLDAKTSRCGVKEISQESITSLDREQFLECDQHQRREWDRADTKKTKCKKTVIILEERNKPNNPKFSCLCNMNSGGTTHWRFKNIVKNQGLGSEMNQTSI